MQPGAGPTGPERPEHAPAPPVRGLATVGSDMAAVSGARIAGFAFGAATVVLTTRLLGPAGYAQVAYAVVLSTLVFTVSSAWTAPALVRHGREELERHGTILRASWARVVLTLPLVAAACLLVAGINALGLLPEGIDGPIVALALCSGLFLTSSEHMVVLVEAAGSMRLSALGLLLRGALVAVALGILALAGAGLSAEAVVALGAGASAALTLGLAPAVWRLALWPVAVDRAAIRRMLVFSIPMVAFSASQYGMRTVDIVVLGAFEGRDVVGIYAAAFQAFVMLSQLTTTLTIVLVPLFVSMQHAGRADDLRDYLSRRLPQLTLGMGLLVALAAPLVALLIPVVLGDAYAGAADPLVVLLGALLVQGVASLAAPVMMLYERTRATAAISVAALAVNIAGDVVLVGALGAGATGPAVASLAAMSVIAIGYLVVAGKMLGVRPRLSPVAAIAPAASIAASLVLPVGAALLAGVAATVAGAAAAVATGLCSREDLTRLRELRRRRGAPGPSDG